MKRLSRLAVLLILLICTPLAAATELIVSAAASLTDAFQNIGNAYQSRYPDDKVTFNFAASDVLLQQIVQGAPADVFASADQIAMDKAVTAKAVATTTRADFAANQIVLVTARDSALPLRKLQDLTSAAVKRVTYGDPASVPAGRYTRSLLQQAGLWDAVAAKAVPANNVRQALHYVARGEVDAGFVFATDAAAQPDRVKVVARPASPTAITYPIAVTAESRHPTEAARFVAFVRSPEGQRILARYGFLKP